MPTDDAYVVVVENGVLRRVMPDGSLVAHESLTDWKRVASWTDDEIDAMIAADPDGGADVWDHARPGNARAREVLAAERGDRVPPAAAE
jgi:hypothetical protein